MLKLGFNYLGLLGSHFLHEGFSILLIEGVSFLFCCGRVKRHFRLQCHFPLALPSQKAFRGYNRLLTRLRCQQNDGGGDERSLVYFFCITGLVLWIQSLLLVFQRQRTISSSHHTSSIYCYCSGVWRQVSA